MDFELALRPCEMLLVYVVPTDGLEDEEYRPTSVVCVMLAQAFSTAGALEHGPKY